MTTDTALLVSFEILELSKSFQDLKFVDDPEIPLDAAPFLDKSFNLENLQSEPQDLIQFSKQTHTYTGVDLPPVDNADIQKSEATIMDGFRYRTVEDLCE